MDVDFVRKIAELEIGVETADFAADQLILTSKPGESPGAAAELLNIRMRELDQSLTELAVEAIGYYGLGESHGEEESPALQGNDVP